MSGINIIRGKQLDIPYSSITDQQKGISVPPTAHKKKLIILIEVKKKHENWISSSTYKKYYSYYQWLQGYRDTKIASLARFLNNNVFMEQMYKALRMQNVYA